MPCRSRSIEHSSRVVHGVTSSPEPARTVLSTHSPQSTLRVTSTQHGPWKACTLCDRCTPSICRSGWRKAVYRFRVRTLSLCYHIHLSPEFSPSSFMHRPDTEFISNPTVRSFTETYLGFGETVFNAIQGTVVTSPYFKRSDQQ